MGRALYDSSWQQQQKKRERTNVQIFFIVNNNNNLCGDGGNANRHPQLTRHTAKLSRLYLLFGQGAKCDEVAEREKDSSLNTGHDRREITRATAREIGRGPSSSFLTAALLCL